MQLDKAIEINTLALKSGSRVLSPDEKASMHLATEALKAIAAWRKDWIGNRFHFLPGESYGDPSPRPRPLFNKRFPHSPTKA